MFEQALKNIDDILRTDSGSATELDYIEQSSWILFLKYLDDLEIEKQKSAQLSGRKYSFIIDQEYRWDTWACPKDVNGKLDHNKAMTGDDLNDFVNGKLIPYLKKFKMPDEPSDTIQYKIGEIFSELKNKIASGYALRNILDIVDSMHFQTQSEKHELSHLYESKIAKMGNAGRNGGEYYTPRPLIRAIVKVVAPKIGDKIYDGAVGSAGFLVEAFDYLKASKGEKLSVEDLDNLQRKTFFGKEIKSLAYIIGIMNMILHGIEAPNIRHMNTLTENIMDIEEKDRFDIVLANPPFGADMPKQIQQNFPIRSSESSYLFLQHFIKSLKAGGKAGIVISNTFLSNGDASVLRKELLQSCNLYTVLDLPPKVFSAGVKTVVLFFEKGKPTENIWYYQLNLGRTLGKTSPLNESDLADFVSLQKTSASSPNSWTVNKKDISPNTYDLSPKNPNIKEMQTQRTPIQILSDIEKIDFESRLIIASIKEIVQ